MLKRSTHWKQCKQKILYIFKSFHICVRSRKDKSNYKDVNQHNKIDYKKKVEEDTTFYQKKNEHISKRILEADYANVRDDIKEQEILEKYEHDRNFDQYGNLIILFI